MEQNNETFIEKEEKEVEKEKTWGVRVSDEYKKRIELLQAESGLKGKDFMGMLIGLYESDQLKQIQPMMASDLSELEMITRRIVDIFNHMCQKVTVSLEDKEHQTKEVIKKKQEIVDMLQEKIKKTEANEIVQKEINAQLTEELDKTKKTNDDIKKLNESNASLIYEYKEKNDTLTSLVTGYKKYKDEKELLEKKIIELQTNLNKSNSDVEKLKHDFASQKESHLTTVKQIQEQLRLDKEKELIEKDKIHNLALQSVNHSYNERLKAIMDEYASKVSSFAEQKIEEQKNVNNKSKKQE